MAVAAVTLPVDDRQAPLALRGRFGSLVGPAVVVLVLASLPWWVPKYWLFLCGQSAVYALAVLSLIVLRRATGGISLCQASFMGIGAYACAWLTTSERLPLTAAMAISVLVAVVVGAALALPALRLQGLQLSVLTICTALAANAVIFNSGAPLSLSVATEGASIPTGARPFGIGIASAAAVYWVLLGVAVVVFVLVAVLLRGAIGATWQAMRSGNWAAWASGIQVTRYKILGFAIASTIAAISGVMLIVSSHTVVSSSFDIPTSLSLVVFAMFVGMESLPSAVVAGVITAAGPEILQTFSLSGDIVTTVIGAFTVAAIVIRARREGAPDADR